jgi:ABC-type branched-subunit amino acid transport system ATPase component
MGMIRSFQDAALFPTLTVADCVALSLERRSPMSLPASLLGFPGAERHKLARATELLAWMGLGQFRSSRIQELSTGTRRVVELACVVALEPDLMLLDEPSSGVAQHETEALGELLVRLRSELSLSMILIEHDIPLVMALSDRVICMADGEAIATGTPAEIQADPRVVAAYLGGSMPRSTGASH